MSRHHRIDYIEFSVQKLAEAKAFYHAAFGWEFTDYGPGYAGIHREGVEMGGLSESEEVTTGGPLVVLFTDDLEASLSSVKNAGGEIQGDVFSFPGGRRFHFKDPSGNLLACWTET